MIKFKEVSSNCVGITYDFTYDDGDETSQVKYNYHNGNVHLIHPGRLEDLAPGYLRDAVTEQAEKDFEGWKNKWIR